MKTIPPHPNADLATNRRLATKLLELADLLEQQQADGFRVAAYRRAADVLNGLAVPADRLLAEGGREALEALPAIGRGIAAAIAEMIVTGRWSRLDRLRGKLDPEALFQTLPGIGPRLAARICSELHLENLAALEVAAYDGRLDQLPGFGPRRLQMVRSVLAERLGRSRFGSVRPPREQPDVSTLLDVDAEYRHRSENGQLTTIAPRRFNPEGVAWLPILHTSRGPWQFTASSTPRLTTCPKANAPSSPNGAESLPDNAWCMAAKRSPSRSSTRPTTSCGSRCLTWHAAMDEAVQAQGPRRLPGPLHEEMPRVRTHFDY